MKLYVQKIFFDIQRYVVRL